MSDTIKRTLSRRTIGLVSLPRLRHCRHSPRKTTCDNSLTPPVAFELVALPRPFRLLFHDNSSSDFLSAFFVAPRLWALFLMCSYWRCSLQLPPLRCS